MGRLYEIFEKFFSNLTEAKNAVSFTVDRSKHNGLERNGICDNPLQMLSMWYVTTSVKQVTCEDSHQRLRKPFPVHPGVPLLRAADKTRNTEHSGTFRNMKN